VVKPDTYLEIVRKRGKEVVEEEEAAVSIF
jgi:hypothetical protein